MKREKLAAFLVSLALLIFGVVLIIWPEAALNAVAKGLSILSICIGIVLLLSYLFKRDLRAFGQWKLMLGVTFILVGMFLLPRLGIVLSVVPFILGILVVCSGIAKLLHGLEYRKLGYPGWWLSVLIAVGAVILGIIAVINPFSTVKLAIRVIGVFLVLDNFANVFDTVYIGYRLNKDGYVVVNSEDDVIDIIQKD